MYFVYALYSVKFDRIYIGFTSDPEQRFRSHNDPENNRYTGKYRPWRIIYTEQFDLKSSAIRREKELKSFRGREFIRSLIQ